MKRTMMFLALTLWIMDAVSMNAQVRIGDDATPMQGAVWDLNNRNP